MKILLIEDNEADQFIIRKMLNNIIADSEVNTVNSLQKAKQSIQRTSYDLILLDFYLPDGDGLEFLEQMKKLKFCQPVIMLTNSSDPKLGDKAIEAGAQDYFVKESYNEVDLKKAIRFSQERIKQILELEQANKKTIEAMKIKENFMSIMTHELLTPLTGIINGIQLLRSDLEEGKKENQCLDLCSIVEESGNNLHITISNILDYAAMDNENYSVSSDRIEVESLISFIDRRFRETIEAKGLSFFITKSKAVPDIIESDLRRIQQIYYNLLSNSLKFTEKGSISVEFDLKDNQLLTKISDTGVGIKKDYLDYIFSEFSQEDTSMTRNYQGTGLGLSLVKKIVNLLDGTIHVDSEEDKGTNVTIYIPLKLNILKQNIHS